MPGRPVHSFDPHNNLPPPGCHRYVPALDNVPEELRGGLDYTTEERLRFRHEHQTELEWDYACVTEYEGLISQKLASTARTRYNLLFEKYSDICRLYKDLCISVEVALCALFNYEGTVENLPSFTMELLRAKLLELVDFNTRHAQWESKRVASAPARIEDFNTIQRRMNMAAPLIFTCEHGIDAGIHRQMKTYFEGQNLTLCALMTPIADGYADMFGRIRSAYDHMREGPMNLIEAHEDLVICAAEMKAVSGNFRALNGIPPI